VHEIFSSPHMRRSLSMHNSSPPYKLTRCFSFGFFSRLRIASFKARSNSCWSLSSKRSFGMFRTGFDPAVAATAHWSTSADPPCRRNAIRTNGGASCRTLGLSRVTSKAASIIFRITI
jgi:hypothetical protein